MILQHGFYFAKHLEIFQVRLHIFVPYKQIRFKFLDSLGKEIMISLKYKPAKFQKRQ